MSNMGLVHSRSTVGSSNIHFQFTPKYRREVFESKKVQAVCDQAYREIAQKLGLIYHAHEFGPDHDHVFVGNTMKYTVSYLIQQLKGYSSRKIRAECWEEIKDKLWGDSFWHDGYFHEFIGRFTNDSMKYYIERQQKKHWTDEDYDYVRYQRHQYEQKKPSATKPLNLTEWM